MRRLLGIICPSRFGDFKGIFACVTRHHQKGVRKKVFESWIKAADNQYATIAQRLPKDCPKIGFDNFFQGQLLKGPAGFFIS
jgi:hypothetical protein